MNPVLLNAAVEYTARVHQEEMDYLQESKKSQPALRIGKSVGRRTKKLKVTSSWPNLTANFLPISFTRESSF